VKLFRPRLEAGSGQPGTVLQADMHEAGILVACGRGAVRIREVQPPGKRRMNAAEWVRGRGVAAGDRFGAEA
jgi:methionyl-tRNA formyltransferase